MTNRVILDEFEDLDAAMREVLRHNYDSIIAHPFPASALVRATAAVYDLGPNLQASFIETASWGFARVVLEHPQLH